MLQVDVQFARDFLLSGNGTLRPEIWRLGLDTLRSLKDTALELGAAAFQGIATEVFRKATNGTAWVDCSHDNNSTLQPLPLQKGMGPFFLCLHFLVFSSMPQ